MIDFLTGMNAAAAAVAGTFFVRFWYQTSDRLFASFAVAFFLLSVHWIGLGLTSPAYEFRPLLYGIRLVASLVILAAIVDKNRTKRSSG
jgi:hypothetical protein